MILRRWVGVVSKSFPPKHVAERILPWLSVCLAAIGGYWAIFEYRNDLAIQRVKTTLELHKNYTAAYTENAKTLRDANAVEEKRKAILELRCKFYVEQIRLGLLDSSGQTLPTCTAISSSDLAVLDLVSEKMSSVQRAALRESILSVFASRYQIDAAWVDSMSLFFRSVIVCVDKGNCDPETSAALFARDMTAFLNFVCPHHQRMLAGGKNETIFIARFLLRVGVDKNIYWSNDKKRESLFICGYLRSVKAKA